MKEGFFSKAKESIKKAVKTGGLIAATGAALIPKESEAQTQKPKERQPIEVSNPNDPSLRAYKDSVNAHNIQNIGIKTFDYLKSIPLERRANFIKKYGIPYENIAFGDGPLSESFNRQRNIGGVRWDFDNRILTGESHGMGETDLDRPVPFPMPVQPVIYKQKTEEQKDVVEKVKIYTSKIEYQKALKEYQDSARLYKNTQQMIKHWLTNPDPENLIVKDLGNIPLDKAVRPVFDATDIDKKSKIKPLAYRRTEFQYKNTKKPNEVRLDESSPSYSDVPVYAKPKFKPVLREKKVVPESKPEKVSVDTVKTTPLVQPIRMDSKGEYKIINGDTARLYQGYDFISETGLRPGYWTSEQVKQAKIKKLQEKIKKDLGK